MLLFGSGRHCRGFSNLSKAAAVNINVAISGAGSQVSGATQSGALSTTLQVLEHAQSAEALPVVSVALAIPAGARWSKDPLGISAAIYKQALLTRPSASHSRLAWCREAQLRGGPVGITLTRNHLVLESHIHARFLPDVLSLFSGLLRGSLEMEEWMLAGEIAEKAQLDRELGEADARGHLLDIAHRVAYRSQGLGNPLWAPSGVDMKAMKAWLADFHDQATSRAGSQLLVLVNRKDEVIRHEQLQSLVQSQFNLLPQHHRADVPNEQYYGGEARVFNAHREGALLAFPAVASAGQALLLKHSLLRDAKISAEPVISEGLFGLYLRDPTQLPRVVGKLRAFTGAVSRAARAATALEMHAETRRERLLSALCGLEGRDVPETDAKIAGVDLSRMTLVVEGPNQRKYPYLSDLQL